MNRILLATLLLLPFVLIAQDTTTCSQLTIDLDGDLQIGAGDILLILGDYGTNLDVDGDMIPDCQDECMGVYDVCGICNGPGSIYTCGCTSIPEGDCDCNGNQLDALGNCGGSCFSDYNQDGICDESACELDSIEYNNYWYSTVSISGQCWFQENLQTFLYANGDSIDFYEDYTNWTFAYQNQIGMAGPPYPELGSAWDCNTLIGGLHYNWWTVTDERGLCPNGWHIPSISEFNGLGELFSSNELRTTNDHWLDEPSCSGGVTQNWDGTNISGFSAVKAYSIWQWGYTIITPGQSLFWTNEEWSQSGFAWRFRVDDTSLTHEEAGNGFSIRCIKD